MPSQILHIMFAEDVYSSFRAVIPAESILGGLRSAFVLGCQGPDIFYHNQRSMPLALHYGSILHRRSFGDFSACLLKKAFVGAEVNAKGSYALGFVTHAFLDRACHPYIIYRGADYHSFFERIIDILMLKALRGLEPADWDQQKILAETCESPPHGLKEMIAQCLGETFPEKTGRDKNLARRIDNAFTDAARFYNMSSPSRIASSLRADTQEKPPQFTRRALNYVYPENLPPEIDFLNLDRKPWRYPYICAERQAQKDDNRSLPEIYQDAVKFALDTIAPIINQYFETGTLPIDAAQRIGNQGLSILDENGKPCAPNLTDQLPLGQVMEQQRKLRGVE